MARCAAQIRQLEHHLSPVPEMERGRGLGDRSRDARRSHGGQRPLQHRQHHSPRPCLGSGRKRGTHRRALGRSRGGFTSKLHCLADALGRPLAFHLTVGEAADCKAYDALIGLPERKPDALLADKGYDADAIRADLVERKIQAVIPGRSNRRVKIEHDRVLYKQRNRIERMFGHLKINRAIATRYDQLANSFLGMVHLATARYWLKFVHAA
jgi:transposase